jgi:hypothetical protein
MATEILRFTIESVSSKMIGFFLKASGSSILSEEDDPTAAFSIDHNRRTLFAHS